MKTGLWSFFSLSLFKILVTGLLLLLFVNLPLVNGSGRKRNWEFDNLKHRLVADGFSETRIEKIFKDPDVFFNPKGVSLFFIHSESTLNYNQFLSDKSIQNAHAYMEKYKKELNNAQKRYGVDETIITAIILVETRFGSYLGHRAVLNTLATMACLDDKKVKEYMWRCISGPGKLTRKKFNKKVMVKSKWAYSELKALLKYSNREKINPAEVTGSYAGAMGIAQFMPSKALSLAEDGNNDGHIDLFNHSDAIYSIANYLKHFGWTPSTTRKAAHRILYKYNHSNYYVDTLLKISHRLKG